MFIHKLDGLNMSYDLTEQKINRLGSRFLQPRIQGKLAAPSDQQGDGRSQQCEGEFDPPWHEETPPMDFAYRHQHNDGNH